MGSLRGPPLSVNRTSLIGMEKSCTEGANEAEDSLLMKDVTSAVEELLNAFGVDDLHKIRKELSDGIYKKAMQERREEYDKWSAALSKEEKKLQSRALELDNLFFQDICFKGSDSVEPVSLSVKDFLGNIDLQYWMFRITENEEYDRGSCNFTHKTITIDRYYLEDTAVLLHEMTHAYVGSPDYFGILRFPHFAQAVTLRLYNKLLPIFSGLGRDLDEMIRENFTFPPSIEDQHDTLFLLTSLDMDLVMKYELLSIRGDLKNH